MGRRSRIMASTLVAFAIALVSTQVAAAQPALPSTFKSQIVHSPAGADIFVRSAGTGPVVVLIHGYAETSDSWAPLAAELEKPYTHILPALHGIGRSPPSPRRSATTPPPPALPHLSPPPHL